MDVNEVNEVRLLTMPHRNTLAIMLRIVDFLQEISLELTLGYSWTDARLKHLGRNRSEQDFVLLNPSVLKHIWLPDLFFGNLQKDLFAMQMSVPHGNEHDSCIL